MESTIALLTAELPRLEERQRVLEQDLAVVTARLGAVRSALTSLQALSDAAMLPEAGAGGGRPAADEAAGEVPAPGTVPPRRRGSKSASGKQPSASRDSASPKAAAGGRPTGRSSGSRSVARGTNAKKSPAAPKPVPVGAVRRTSRLSQDILDHLAQAPAPLRAGEVNTALGREESRGSINAVRTSLERLAKAAKVERSGRGLYQAVSG
ncbi:hypothetical protein [Kitasatospora sp. GAS204B]|uniref:hypothetical protein n=1 Tax=unclassified Kitasatospora TaxID=2633591 RepID=UPI00247521A2|nr:hypothetical protein [Kitasatospora sp. GAS204B]